MELRSRWRRFLGNLADLGLALRYPRTILATVGAGSEEQERGSLWIACLEGLETVLLPQDEYAWLLCRIRNAGRYWLDGETGAAEWEIQHAFRRSIRLMGLLG